MWITGIIELMKGRIADDIRVAPRSQVGVYCADARFEEHHRFGKGLFLRRVDCRNGDADALVAVDVLFEIKIHCTFFGLM
jgi:hypothetical protein